MLRNSKKEDETIDEESGDESPLIVPRSRSDTKNKSSSTSSYSLSTWIFMLALVVGMGVGKLFYYHCYR